MTSKKVKKILYMGCYGNAIHRNIIFINGLKKNEIDVIEYNVKSHNIFKNLIAFFKNFKRLKKQNFELILFHSEAFIQFYLAKILALIKRIPLIHDIFISKLQTIYDDRKQFEKRKIPKILLRIILFTTDLIECSFSDYLILDTYSHIKFFHEKFKTPLKKFRKVLVGSMNNIFYPIENEKDKKEKFLIGFAGTFIPLQGVEYIIEAAKILENNNQIIFHFIGDGQTYRDNKKLAEELKIKNIIFFGRVPLINVREMISKCDVKLGIFGNTPKALQVIPTKVFDGMAMKKPMISADTPAIRELFTNNENILLCEIANPKSLAEAILKLKKDKILREKIAENAYTLYKKYCTLDVIGKRLIQVFNGILNKK